MNEKIKRIVLLSSMPIPKALMAMGFPTMLGMMINAVYNLVDAYFVGGLGTSQMGAISVAFPLGQVIVGLGLLFGNGAASYISRLLGQGEKKSAGNVTSTTLYSSIFVGAVVILLVMVFLKPILSILGATASIMPYAVSYARVYVISSLFTVFNVTMNSIVTSEGAPKTTMCALLMGAILNIILEPIFIYTLDLGITGAAIATAIAQMVSTLVYIKYIADKKSSFSFRISEFCLSREIFAEILKIGIPTLAFQLLTSIAISLSNMEAARYGDSAIAGIGAVTRIISFGTLIVFGFIKGFQPIAGYNFGAKNYGRLREAIKTAVVWSSAFCVILGLILAAFPTAIISRFTKEDELLITVGKKALRANGLSFMLFGFYTVYSSLFLALGKAKEGFLLGICRQGLCFVPVILIVPAIWGLNGVLYAQPIADAIATVIAVCMSMSLKSESAFEKSYAGPKKKERPESL